MTIACQTVNVLAVGSLRISSTPSGAEIWLALQPGSPVDQGVTTIAGGSVISNLQTGTYNIRLTLAGYNDWTGTATVSEGVETTVDAILTPSVGSASFSSTPSGAQIWIDGSNTGFTTPYTVPNLTPGSHTYQLKLAGYYDEPSPPGTFDIIGGQTTVVPTVVMDLVVGALNISSTPSGAQIWLAPTGSPLVYQGVITPAIIGNLTPGVPYTYELRLIDYYPKSGTFTLVDGETITRSETLDLRPCPESLRYEGNTITLQATPRDGTSPYYVEFRKNGVAIPGNDPLGRSYTIPSATEDVQLTRTYVLTNEDIRTASTGTIDFEAFMSDSCPAPLGPKTCDVICTVNIGCLAPVCNFTVT